jgi:predicted Abi (CAAX) family protease
MHPAHAQESVTIDWQPIDQGMQPLQTVAAILISSSIVGVLSWIIGFAIHRDGIHRLASVNPIYPRKLTS